MCRIIFPLFTIFLLSACIGRIHQLPAAPSPTVTPLPSIAEGKSPHTDLSPVPQSSPAPVPLFLVLADFPLAVGAIWEYSTEISYGDPNDPAKLLTWNGIVRDRIIDRRTEVDGRDIFRVQEDLEPRPPEQVWRQPGTFEYIVSGDGVFKNTIKVYQYPLEDGRSWQAFSEPGYQVTSQRLGEVYTPYGILNHCYFLILATNPDTTTDTFCSGIGFVVHTYSHHGTLQEEKLVLNAFTPGKP